MSSGPSIRGSLDTESDMLPQDPPPFIIRWTAWLLLAFLGVALLLSIFLKLPETVRCPFVPQWPATGADSIQSPRQGMIVKAVTEGQKVTKDAELFVLRSDEVRGWETSSHTMGEELKSKTQSLAQFDAAYDAQFQIKKEEVEQARSGELVFAKNHTRTSRDLVNRMEKLAKQGGESEVEFIKLRLDLAGSEKDLSVSQRALQTAMLDQHRFSRRPSIARQRQEMASEIEKVSRRGWRRCTATSRMRRATC